MRSVRTTMVSPLRAGAAAPGTPARAPAARAPRRGWRGGLARRRGAAGVGTAALEDACGAGLGRFSFSQASHSMSREKPKMKNRMRRWVSMASRALCGGGQSAARAPGTGSTPPGCHGPQRQMRRADSQLAAQRAVPLQRLFGIGGAAGMEPAGRRQQRAQEIPVTAYQGLQDSAHRVLICQLHEQPAQTAQHRHARPRPERRAHQHVDRAQARLLQPESLADAALYSVAHGRPCRMLARNEDAQARRTFRARRREEGIAGPAASCTLRAAGARNPPCSRAAFLRPARSAPVWIHRARRRKPTRRGACDPWRAGAQHGATLRRTAAHKKPVRSCAPRLGRLVSALLLHWSARSEKGRY